LNDPFTVPDARAMIGGPGLESIRHQGESNIDLRTLNGRGYGMEKNLLNIGFGNTVVAERVVAIVSPNSAPMKRLKDEARDEKHLVDATHGRRTRSIIIMDSNHIVLSAIQAETISQRFETLKEHGS
jgi:extracellular matrix regulatory protein A